MEALGLQRDVVFDIFPFHIDGFDGLKLLVGERAAGGLQLRGVASTQCLWAQHRQWDRDFRFVVHVELLVGTCDCINNEGKNTRKNSTTMMFMPSLASCALIEPSNVSQSGAEACHFSGNSDFDTW